MYSKISLQAHGKVDDSATKKPAKSTKVTVKKDELDVCYYCHILGSYIYICCIKQ